MKNYKMREISLAVAATIGLSATLFCSTSALAADKAASKSAGTYVTGDFHNHTTCSDGALSLKRLVDKSAGTFGLDWFAQAGHGGSGTRNCTLAEDPYEPVPPALGLTSTAPFPPGTYPTGGQPATMLKGPNQTWVSTLPNGVASLKGDPTTTVAGATRGMWKWQAVQEFIYPVIEAESRARSKPIFVGVEQNNPGHEHTSTAIITGQLPSTGTGNANAVAQYEYCFDRSDTDRSRGAANQWDCAVTGGIPVDPTARKIIVASGTGSGTAGHAKSLEGVKWMAANHPNTSYFIPAHLERAGAFNPNGNNGFNVEHLRNFNNAAPAIAFGFESMPGHQADAQRGSYQTTAVGGGTYGGSGIYAARVGGVWDALLGEGRNWFFFASSDYHNRGRFGADQRESDADFFPGEYTKDYVMARTGASKLGTQAIVDGLRSGNSFVVTGDLIDRLSYVACTSNPALPRKAALGAVQASAVAAAAAKADVRMDGCATMGEKLVVRTGADVVVSIVVRDPVGKNNSPYSFPNPSLRQVNITQPLDAPVLDHIDVIGGNVTGFVSPASEAYSGLEGSASASNSSARLLRTFNSTNWTASADGTRTMTFRIPAVQVSQYLRLRGSNLPAAVPFETDAAGNPLLDFGLDGNVLCTDTACPAHMVVPTTGVNAGKKTSSLDVASWADLWFYSNPIFIEVASAVKVAGVK